MCTPGSTVPCYSGADGTKGVGDCKAGLATCASDGASFGPCTGEVVPVPESCSTVGDENCDGQANENCGGTAVHAKKFGGASDQSGKAVAMSASRIAITGAFAGTIDLGGGSLVSAGSTDGYVAMFDRQGDHLWSKSFGDAQAQSAQAVALDAAGNVFVAGEVSGTADFGCGAVVSAGQSDVFVAKLSPTGQCLWSKRFGDAGVQSLGGVAVDADGNVVLCGSLAGTVDFGTGALTSAGSFDAFVAKFGPAGATLWAKRYGDASMQHARKVAMDESGNIRVAGELNGSADFGGGVMTSAGGSDVFLVSLDAAGTFAWGKRFGDSVSQQVSGVAVGPQGRVVISGTTPGAIDFGGGALTSAGSTDAYVAEFDSQGGHLWSRLFGAGAADSSRGVSVDAAGSVVVTGDFMGTVNFGGIDLAAAGGTDVFVVKVDSAGTAVWAKRYGDAAAQSGAGVAADLLGIALLGDFAGTTDFGTGALVSAGGADVFLAYLLP